MDIPNSNYSEPSVKVLVVNAHPDDEAVCAASTYKITQHLNGVVDLALMTNGEGGYQYAILAEKMYGLPLTQEAVGRAYLPAIRKKELLNAGAIVGIRNYFFMEQADTEYSLDPKDVLDTGAWDIDFILQQLCKIITKGKYDYVWGMLPFYKSHGHHLATTILALRAVQMLPPENRPIVLGTSSTLRYDPVQEGFEGLAGYPITNINTNAPIFTFDKTQPFGKSGKLNYNILVSWLIAEHKTQGTMQLFLNKGDKENYWYFAANKEDGIAKTQALFDKINSVGFKEA